MDRRWALVQGTLADGEGFFLEDGGILVRGGDIEAVGPSEEIRRRCEGDGTEVISVGGRPVFPGFLNAHHHLYSSLTAGIAPRGAVTDFISNLELLWWHLDRVHDEESVYWSALWGLAQGLRAGVTAVIDHHA
ncbi:MAG TPA: amidohydrolase family protein, partial [Synergistaceae bacterium]|nr:amidohydrolase family protein [Synergistaceae bacterium]